MRNDHYGDYEEALSIRSESLNANLSEYGENSIETVRALGGLGWNKYMSGNYDEAKDLILVARAGSRSAKHSRCTQDRHSFFIISVLLLSYLDNAHYIVIFRGKKTKLHKKFTFFLSFY